MNTNLKIGLAVVVLLLGIFGATVISSYTVRDDTPTTKPTDFETGTAAPAETVRYFNTQIYFDPNHSERAMREFPGFFEVNDQEHSVTYWVVNVNPVPVTVSAIKRSCSACTSMRLAAFPYRPTPPATQAVDGALLGVLGDSLGAQTRREHAMNTLPSTEWKLLDFENPELTQVIPAAESEDKPTWAALKLLFKVRQTGVKTLEATLGFRTSSQSTALATEFRVGFMGVPSFEVVPGFVDFKEMGEGTSEKSEEFLYLSSTIPQEKLAPPRCNEAPSEPFLKFSKPVALTPDELALLALKRSKPNFAARIAGGYRFSMTLHRKNPSPKPGQALELDIGPLEKSFTVFGATDSESQAINVKANVTGLVTLVNSTAVDLGSFSSREGVSKTVSLRSDRLDLELEVASDAVEPKVLQVELGTPRNVDGRRYWDLKIKIAPQATTGDLPVESALVLRAKGTGQLVRLPVKGRAYLP